MTANKIKQVLRRDPFIPFKLQMDNGTVFRVTHPDSMFVANVSCVLLEPTEELHLFDIRHITALSYLEPNGRSPKAKQKRKGGRR
jgi:hypothetical protein